jgi:GxxExxY protein
MELLHKDLTDKIIQTFYKVYRELGYGFLEKVYHNAMLIELTSQGIAYQSQQKITVFYQGRNVGEYFSDITVNGLIILELKASEVLVEANESQLINYLRATEFEVGLLLNFGKNPEIRRKIFTNDRKNFKPKSV